MVKSYNCIVLIHNKTKSKMTYVGEWYDSGRVANGFSWPKTIEPGQQHNILNYERDWALAGCSGYVTYNIFGSNITIGFSNPTVGVNKVGVGTGGKKVWDDMDNHGYNQFTKRIDSGDGKAILQFHCKCTGGSTNTCTVDITAFTQKL